MSATSIFTARRRRHDAQVDELVQYTIDIARYSHPENGALQLALDRTQSDLDASRR